MFKTILVPIDGSDHAQLALELGTDLAQKYDAALILLHVITRDGSLPDELYDAALGKLEKGESAGGKTASGSRPFQRTQVLEQVGHMLLHDASEHAASKGVKNTETVIDTGTASKRILHQAQIRHADLIVMGRRGLARIAGLVMGSVSHNVFHLAPCSCVAVHKSQGQPGFETLKNILVPTDGSDQANKAVEFGSDIAHKYDARLTLTYVMSRGPSLEMLRGSVDMSQLSNSTRDELDPAKHPVAEHMSSSFMPPVLSKSALTEIGEQVLVRGEKTARAAGVQSLKKVLLDGDDPARKIMQVAKKEQADLIAMGSRGLGGAAGLLVGSVSYKVNQMASCASLTVR